MLDASLLELQDMFDVDLAGHMADDVHARRVRLLDDRVVHRARKIVVRLDRRQPQSSAESDFSSNARGTSPLIGSSRSLRAAGFTAVTRSCVTPTAAYRLEIAVLDGVRVHVGETGTRNLPRPSMRSADAGGVTRFDGATSTMRPSRTTTE